MARTANAPNGRELVTLHYHSLRSVVSPEDHFAGRKRYCGIAPAESLLRIEWDDNVRSYLGRDEFGNKRKATNVNLQIKDTLVNRRDLFPLLNTGVVIVARSVAVEDEKKSVTLRGGSIINGAQTMGVLREFCADQTRTGVLFEEEGTPISPSVNFELIVTDDDDLIADVSIARNFQNRVLDLSIYGRKGLFDSLEGEMQRHDPKIKLRKSETDFDDDYFDTEKLVQVITAMMPSQVSVPSGRDGNSSRPETTYRVYAYRHRARCLKDFAKVMEDPDEWPDAYGFFMQVAWNAWGQYEMLKTEQSFSRLHKVKKSGDGPARIVEDVPDGIVFPILSSLSRLVRSDHGRWTYDVPDGFPWRALFNNAMEQFKTTAAHNPNTMGKHAGCYIALHGLFDMFFWNDPDRNSRGVS